MLVFAFRLFRSSQTETLLNVYLKHTYSSVITHGVPQPHGLSWKVQGCLEAHLLSPHGAVYWSTICCFQEQHSQKREHSAYQLCAPHPVRPNVGKEISFRSISLDKNCPTRLELQNWRTRSRVYESCCVYFAVMRVGHTEIRAPFPCFASPVLALIGSPSLRRTLLSNTLNIQVPAAVK